MAEVAEAVDYDVESADVGGGWSEGVEGFDEGNGGGVAVEFGEEAEQEVEVLDEGEGV